MLRKTILAIAATATLGVATLDTADARDRHIFRRHHHGSNVIIGLGGFGAGYGFGRGFYGDRWDRDYGYNSGFGYGNDYYGGTYGYGFRDRFYDRYADDDFGPYCGVKRVKVKQWNRAHTRYVIKTKRIRSCY